MNIILSTHNPSKAEQIKAIFIGTNLNVLTLDEVGIAGEGTEDGNTLQENALKKAQYAFDQIQEKTWCMADDTGIFITSLDGAPGIKAARWAGEDATTKEVMVYVLDRLKNKTDRSAKFETVVALISPEGKQHFFTGNVEGVLLESPRTKPQPKMPYSPIFKPNVSDKTWAEMTVDEENKISHRGKAFTQVREFFS